MPGQNVHFSLSLTFILLSRTCVDIYYAELSIVTLLVSCLLLFSTLWYIQTFWKKYSCSWNNTLFVGHQYIIHLLWFNVVYSSHGGLIYTSLFSPLNHSYHCFGIGLTKALYSNIEAALFCPNSALIPTKERRWITSYNVSIPLFHRFGKKRIVPLHLVRSILNRCWVYKLVWFTCSGLVLLLLSK